MSKCWGADLSATELLVLLAMADHGDDEGGNVRPGVELLATKTGLSARSVQRIQQGLVHKNILLPLGYTPHGIVQYSIDLHAIPRTENYAAYSKRRRAAKQRQDELDALHLKGMGGDTLSPVTLCHPGDTPSPVTLCQEGVTPVVEGGDTSGRAYKVEPSEEPYLNHQGTDVPESSISDADGDEEEPSECAAYTDEQKLPVFAERSDFLKRYAQVNGIVPNLQQQREYLTSWAFKNGIDVGIVLQMCSSPKESAA